MNEMVEEAMNKVLKNIEQWEECKDRQTAMTL